MIKFVGVFAVVTFLFYIYQFIIVSKGFSQIPRLPRATNLKSNKPLVSVILAAKDEEISIEQTIAMLAAQDYLAFEIIVINDRSIDLTAEKLEGMQNKYNKMLFQVINIQSLPKGWVGKNHALYQGYLRSRGQYLLFTDADIFFEKNTLTDAIHYLSNHKIDHLTLFPNMISNQYGLRAFIHYFIFSFFTWSQPWKANNPSDKESGIGIGAFNLISRDVYQKIGTHQAIAMRPDDDLQLGSLVKKKGFNQHFISGSDHLKVEWYPNLKQAFTGLEKNIFSGFGYSMRTALLAVVLQLVFLLHPFIGVWIYGSFYSIMYLLDIIFLFTLYIIVTQKFFNYRLLELFTLPVMILLTNFVILRSVYLINKNKGINWRGTFYSLNDLKGLDPKIEV